jgi:hypothetical protein
VNAAGAVMGYGRNKTLPQKLHLPLSLSPIPLNVMSETASKDEVIFYQKLLFLFHYEDNV